MMLEARQAEAVAQVLLATDLPRRWRQSVGARRAGRPLVGGCRFQGDLLVAAAWLHDIGYSSQLTETGFHPIDGARHLRGLGADERVVNLVAHHSCALIEARLRGVDALLAQEFPQDMWLPHDELCFCDQTTGPDGEVLDVIERLAEIRTRYEDGHVVRQFVDVAEPELVGTVRRIEAAYLLQPR